jgi:hypothetical protein
MLEADPLRFGELQRRYLSNPNVFCINELVTFEGERCLDSLLMSTPLPEIFDLMSIDVDGNDYHVWDTLHCFKPRVVVIEYNPTIPSSVVFIQASPPPPHQICAHRPYAPPLACVGAGYVGVPGLVPSRPGGAGQVQGIRAGRHT